MNSPLRTVCWMWMLLLATAEAAVPVIPERVRSSVRQRVDAGYNQSVVVGLLNRDGRDFYAYGTTAVGSATPPDAETLFEIGSITKVFTTLLLADGVQRGEVTLSGRVQDLMGGTVVVPRRNGEITLEHLATHGSGLPVNPDNLCPEVVQPFECYDGARLEAFLNQYTLTREPGGVWEYSNLGMGLLGEALARRAGMTYEQLLAERILNPLGLRDTTGTFPLPPGGRPAQGHSGVVVRPAFRISGLEGAGFLRSNVADLLTFLEFQLGFRDSPLAPAIREAQRRRRATAYPGIDIGLGWWLWGLPGGQVIQHGGDTPGQTACIAFHPGRGIGAVVLSNSRFNAYAAVTDLCLHLLDSQYPLTVIRRPATVPPEVLRTYAGLYKSADGDVFDVLLTHGRLVLHHFRSDFRFTVYPQDSQRFLAVDVELGPNANARFASDGDGRVVRMDWFQNGGTTAYVRQPSPPSLTLTPESESLRLDLSAAMEAPYTIERSPDLEEWQNVGVPVAGDRTLLVPAPTSLPAFFRIGVRWRNEIERAQEPARALPWVDWHSQYRH
ncbi:MAG: serine hydrolase [Verrucomicrobiales bacterium]|nr:serine hydrolase [Verrucomicrobiales bacterium]